MANLAFPLLDIGNCLVVFDLGVSRGLVLLKLLGHVEPGVWSTGLILKKLLVRLLILLYQSIGLSKLILEHLNLS